jgi:hypothetical protein
LVQIAQWFTETEKHLYHLLQGVSRAADTHGATIQHMRVDHRHVQPLMAHLVAHRFLNRVDVLVSFPGLIQSLGKFLHLAVAVPSLSAPPMSCITFRMPERIAASPASRNRFKAAVRRLPMTPAPLPR